MPRVTKRLRDRKRINRRKKSRQQRSTRSSRQQRSGKQRGGKQRGGKQRGGQQRGGMYATTMGTDRIPVSEGANTVVIKTIEGVPTAMSDSTYERDYKATGEDVGQI
jgi:hypothetical protein